ncbi:CD3337/EF1877 family mobilome membrane protein [Peribacillus frigoritolerans]|uniref:CD3337/EF1877 family mobilome membrane protein n=1 Tax=Peribacillus frigoritolerans TaxID=450367 RepID=UPI0039A13BF0
MSKKKVALLFLTLFLLLPTLVSAAPNEEGKSDGTISGTLFEKDYSKLEDESKANYYLDVSSKTGNEEDKNAAEKFFDSAKSWATGDAIKDGISSQFYEFINLVTNLIFEWNKIMSNIMIGFLNFSFETDIIDAWIDEMDKMMTNLSGVSGLRFTENGLFGSFIGLIVVSAGLAAVYQMVFKRATFASMDTILKTILTLSLALLLFTNFAPFMKGMNNISNQLSQTLLTGSSNTITADDRTPDELREGVSDNLWDMFITRPYLIMQYGNEDVDEIGVNRVNELLKMQKGEERQKYIEQIEISENENKMMTYDNVPDRFVFTFIYSVINIFVSIPIFLLSLALIVFQVWFLLMGFISPFVLVWAAFPGQFGVLKKYSIELAYPLICKFIATVATTFIFTLGFLIYNIGASGGISQYLVIVFMQFVMFCMLFLLRKRIGGVFTAGNSFIGLRQDISSLKESISQLGASVVHIGAAAATGGTSLAVTAAAGEVVSSATQKGASHEVDEDNQEYIRDPNQSDGTKPLANLADIAGAATGTSAAVDAAKTAAFTNQGDEQRQQDDNQGQQEANQQDKEEFDGTKPFASLKDIEEQMAQEEANSSSGRPHLRLVHNSEYQPDEQGQEEEPKKIETNNEGSFPLVSMYDYMDNVDPSSVSGFKEASVSAEKTEENQLNDEDSPQSHLSSTQRFDGTKPFASIHDFQDEEGEMNDSEEHVTDSKQGELPADDDGDVSHRGGASR